MFNPPDNDKEVNALFHNRESELKHGIDYLCESISSQNIMVIHGESRTGKSHFLRKLIIELKKENRPFLFHYVNANSQQTARNVLIDIFRLLKKQIFSFNPNFDHHALAMQQLSIVKDLLIDISPLVSGEREQMICTLTKERITSQESHFSFLPNFVQAIFQSRQELKMGEEKQWVIPMVSDENLIELIKYQVKLLLEIISPEKKQSILLSVDDIDLLCDNPQGDVQVKLLLDLLNQLASDSFFNIVVTLRTESFHDRSKNMWPLQGINIFDNSEMIHIYQKHLNLYNQGNAIYTNYAIEYLIENSDGRIGDFLKNCNVFLNDNYSIYLEKSIIDLPDIKNQVTKIINVFKINKETKKHMYSLIDTIQKEKKLEFESTDILPRVFYDRMIQQDTTNKNQYYINKLFSDVIQEMENNGN